MTTTVDVTVLDVGPNHKTSKGNVVWKIVTNKGTFLTAPNSSVGLTLPGGLPAGPTTLTLNNDTKVIDFT